MTIHYCAKCGRKIETLHFVIQVSPTKTLRYHRACKPEETTVKADNGAENS